MKKLADVCRNRVKVELKIRETKNLKQIAVCVSME